MRHAVDHNALARTKTLYNARPCTNPHEGSKRLPLTSISQLDFRHRSARTAPKDSRSASFGTTTYSKRIQGPTRWVESMDSAADKATPPDVAATGAQAPQPQPMFQRRNRGNVRKRTRADDEDEPEQAAVVQPVKTAREGGLAFSNKRADDDRPQNFRYQSDRTLQQGGDRGATRTIETETAFDRDARALREQVLSQATDAAAASASTYKGMNNYIDYTKGFRREHTIASEKGTGMHGPLRANVNVRSTVRFDYQPDVCKDYKETGYCGYGDSCKFVHDRSDYKSGWELERDWDARQKRIKEAKWGKEGDEQPSGSDSEEEDDLPFACYICRRPWKEVDDPVVTRCKHYFCEHCALKHNAKNKKCFVCEQPTNGIFNVAHDILKKAKAEQQAAA